MQIKKLTLKNFMRFADLAIDFAPQSEQQSNVTVFIGNNGAGKTSILKSLVLSLSWLVARIERERGSGSPISELDILNGASFAQIMLEVEHDSQSFQWSLAKTAKGRKKQAESSLIDTSKLADFFRIDDSTETKELPLPLMVYYPVDRSVLDVPLKIQTKHSFEQIEGYDNALSQGVDFRRFFEWFRDREDVQNEIANSFDGLLDPATMKGFLEKLKSHKDKQLTSVRRAIYSFIPEFSNLKIQRKPSLKMVVDKKGEKKPLNILQLSQGEKSLMALVGDIARRLAMMNPDLENPLEGKGVVLIDEIDMHLHPKWQRSIVSNLQKTFPNCQFILTTHSPAVVSDSPNLLVYELDDGEVNSAPNLYGMEVNQVLLQGMDAEIINEDVQQKLDDILDSIQEQQFDNARKKLEKLEKILSSDNLELGKVSLLLRKMELLYAKNQQK
ncbi:MAG: AAA family ATPase [Methylococcaceae bacterium]|nr:AAA family ATPase [Methylococcaceae bacterium]